MNAIKSTIILLLATIFGLVISCSRGERVSLGYAEKVAEGRLEAYAKQENIPQTKFKRPEVTDHSDFWLGDYWHFYYVFTEGGVRHEFVVTVYRNGNSDTARLIEKTNSNIPH